MKPCSRGNLCFNPNGGQDVLLFDSEFCKNKSTKDGLKSYCKHCKKHYENRHKTKSERQSKGNGQYRGFFHVISERISQANMNSKTHGKSNKTKKGDGKYENIWQVLRTRIASCNTNTTGDENRKMITTAEGVALLIAQNYKCSISGIDFFDDFIRLSPDHVVAFNNKGDNDIQNITWIHSSINHGKNGDDFDYVLDVFLRIGIPGNDEESVSKRKQRIIEVMENVWKAHDIYPQIYEKLKDLSSIKLGRLLLKKPSIEQILTLTINDILKST